MGASHDVIIKKRVWSVNKITKRVMSWVFMEIKLVFAEIIWIVTFV